MYVFVGKWYVQNLHLNIQGQNEMHISVGYILGWAGPGARGKQRTDSSTLIIIEPG